MDDRSFEELIEELHAVKIREAEITVELERRANRAASERTRATIEPQDNGQTSEAAHFSAPFFTNGFKRGDRVRITNKVRKPATSGPTWTEAKERLATVTRVIPDQVHILTDNGTKTWRAPNNLKQVTGPRQA
jgi:hypothetical protein